MNFAAQDAPAGITPPRAEIDQGALNQLEKDAMLANTPHAASNKQLINTLNHAWGVGTVDPVAQELVADAYEFRTVFSILSKKPILFKTIDGQDILWCQSSRFDYIGLPSRSHTVNETSAKVMMSLAKSKGWGSVVVNGKQSERELLWLEAQRQGLQVDNFTPTADSKVLQQWREEQEARKEPASKFMATQKSLPPAQSAETSVSNSKFTAPGAKESTPAQTATQNKAPNLKNAL